MRVLLTGATGFLGAHLLKRLSTEELSVAILVRRGANRWRLDHVPVNVIEMRCDLENLAETEGAVKSFRPEAVIHLAWSGVLSRHRNDSSQIADNILPTLSLLRAAHEVGCLTWIGMGSQAEYGPINAKIEESHPTRPSTLYGIAKLCACLLSERLSAQAGMRFAWLRLFSAYGPMDDPQWMVPSLILSLFRGERPRLTEGSQMWDYLYVGDAAEAILRVVRTEAARGIFNLGSGEAHRIRDIATYIRDLIDPALPLGFGEVPYRPDQVMHLEADIGRLQRAVEWSPRTSLLEGLSKTVEWYREHGNRYDRECVFGKRSDLPQ